MHSSIKMEVVLISFNIVAMFHRRSQTKTYLFMARESISIQSMQGYIFFRKEYSKHISKKFSKRVGMKFGEHTKHSTAARAHPLFQCNGATFACV